MQRYNKRTTVGKFEPGVAYQRDLTIVIMLGAAKHINDGKELQFFMTCEDVDGGRFDDIGFHFKTKADFNTWTRLYIQAKHTQDRSKQVEWSMLKSKSKDEPFAMSKYYVSYRSIKEKFDKLILVLCTNRSLHETVIVSMIENPEIGEQNEIVKDLFCLLSARHYKFNENSVDVFEYLITSLANNEENQINDILDFLRTFILTCETISQETLKEKIKELLTDLSEKLLELQLISTPEETQYEHWTKFVKDWICAKKGKKLNENDIKLFFLYSNLQFASFYHECTINKKRLSEKHEKINVEWKNKKLYKDLERWFKEGTQIMTNNSQEDPYIVLKILDTFKKQQKDLLKSHLFLNGTDFILYKDHVLQLFYGIDEPFLLVIDCTDMVECYVETREFTEDYHAKMIIKIEKKTDSLVMSR